jgi:hypothetical protein
MLVKLIVTLLCHDFVSQETCSFRLCVRDERLFFGEFQFEGVLQKLFYLLLDLFRFSFGASNYVSSGSSSRKTSSESSTEDT